jgi:exodeoxyribonuclease VIII
MRDALYQNAYVRKLLSGEREKEYFWIDSLTGEECKCRVDCITAVGGKKLIVDLKSAASAETEAFIKAAIKHGYDFQSGMYTTGVEACTGRKCGFVFIAIEKDPPYSINILQADKLFILRGNDLFREYIGIYHDCKTTGNWYGYLGKSNIINNLGLPAYLAKEVE